MSAPSPIHRDPDADGDDYGCIGEFADEGNRAVATLVADLCRFLNDGTLRDEKKLVRVTRNRLEAIEKRYDCGCCDTVVKENVFAALHEAVADAGLKPIDRRVIAGW